MAEILSAFLQAESVKPFEWGKRDCLLWLADWGLALSGRDAGEGWRGRCSTAIGAMRILKREGGAVAVMDKAFGAIGFVRADRPRRGDVAIVQAVEGEMGGIVMACREGERRALVALIHPKKLRVRTLPVVAAWTWPLAA